jgi:hypothetical protein
VHRVLAAAGLPVERDDVPGLLVDRIGADLIEVGMHRIEKALRPSERQKRGIVDLEELLLGPVAGGRVHSVDIDAAAVPLALRRREGTNIGEQRRCARLSLGMPATQYHWAGRREGHPCLQHNTPVDALLCGSRCLVHFPPRCHFETRLSVFRKIVGFRWRRSREAVAAREQVLRRRHAGNLCP